MITTSLLCAFVQLYNRKFRSGLSCYIKCPNILPPWMPQCVYWNELDVFCDALQVLHPQSMRPAREADIPVRVKNSYNPKAPGTVITRSRDMSKVIVKCTEQVSLF